MGFDANAALYPICTFVARATPAFNAPTAAVTLEMVFDIAITALNAVKAATADITTGAIVLKFFTMKVTKFFNTFIAFSTGLTTLSYNSGIAVLIAFLMSLKRLFIPFLIFAPDVSVPLASSVKPSIIVVNAGKNCCTTRVFSPLNVPFNLSILSRYVAAAFTLSLLITIL